MRCVAIRMRCVVRMKKRHSLLKLSQLYLSGQKCLNGCDGTHSRGRPRQTSIPRLVSRAIDQAPFRMAILR